MVFHLFPAYTLDLKPSVSSAFRHQIYANNIILIFLLNSNQILTNNTGASPLAI